MRSSLTSKIDLYNLSRYLYISIISIHFYMFASSGSVAPSPRRRSRTSRSGVRICGPTIPVSTGRRSWMGALFWCGTACGHVGAMGAFLGWLFWMGDDYDDMGMTTRFPQNISADTDLCYFSKWQNDDVWLVVWNIIFVP